MECPKCHNDIPDNSAVCPKCKKVLLLQCPNCNTFNETSVCKTCGYNILVKCSKCSKITPIKNKVCSKCGMDLKTSLAYQECESDEFVCLTVKFENLKKIKKCLNSSEMFTKFKFRLKNLLITQLKNIDCKFVEYKDIFSININKELSFATSSNKAIRLAIKIVNAYIELNSNVIKEFKIPLGLNISLTKKLSEQLLDLVTIDNSAKLLTKTKLQKDYLQEIQVILDQNVRDQINKEYKTDSLFSTEKNGQSIMYYEILLDSYVTLPEKPKQEEKFNDIPPQIPQIQRKEVEEKDLYSFNVFDINARCYFQRSSFINILEQLTEIDLEQNGKFLAIRKTQNLNVSTAMISERYAARGYKVVNITCNESMQYQPWGFFKTLFQEYYNLPFLKSFINQDLINTQIPSLLKPLLDFVFSKLIVSSTPEDARFAFMEQWINLLSIMNDTVIIIDGFEFLDDTSIQTLQLYFDKFKDIKPNFVFITSNNYPVHSKFKNLIRTKLYTEFTLQKSTIDACIATLKSDATNFIQSFYFEKIKENFKGSYLYFISAIQYLKETGTLIDFENKLSVKANQSIVLPKTLKSLYRTKIRYLSRNTNLAFTIAYFSILGYRLDFNTLTKLGINDIEKYSNILVKSGLAFSSNQILYADNFNTLSDVMVPSLKKEAEMFLAKNILAQIGSGLDDSLLVFTLGRLGAYKEEYLTLWKNSQFAIQSGDYDAYLKNCLGFLSLIEHSDLNIPAEDIENNKKEVYKNIIEFLYSYSPTKIYFIENILLMDAFKEGDDEKIIKLSNLMLQGALISSNYTDAAKLLHNILSRTQNAKLIVDGEINSNFLLLSLVSVEINYNLGNYSQSIDTMNEILSVLTPDIIDTVKPPSFSTKLFVTHILETCRLVALAKLFRLDEDIETFFESIKISLGVNFPDKDAILAIQNFLAQKAYSTGNIEEYSPYSKIIFLILQEITALDTDYKRFAQNIYQAKLLANDIKQNELELLCDLFIAYAYYKIGVFEKAESIYLDVLNITDKAAMFNLQNIARFLIIKLKLTTEPEKVLLYINDSLADIQKHNNQSKILFVLFEKLYINILKAQNISPEDIESEEYKISPFQEQLSLILD